MQTPINPRIALLTWLRSLAPEDRTDLARAMLRWIPGTQIGDPPSAPQDHEPLLVKFIEEAQVGRILATIALINFFVMRSRGSEAGWEEGAKRSSQARQYRLDEGLISDAKSDEGSTPDEEFPLRAKRWLAYTNDWEELKRTELSFQNLECWTRDVNLGFDA